jgi:hypothetical protein
MMMSVLRRLRALLAMGAVAALLAGCGGGGEPAQDEVEADREGQETPGLERPQPDGGVDPPETIGEETTGS